MSTIVGHAIHARPSSQRNALQPRSLSSNACRRLLGGHQRLWRPAKGSGGANIGRCGLQVQAIGFDLPGGDVVRGTEKRVEDILRASSGLLCFSSVLRGKPAQAFLNVLRRLQGGRLADVLAAYGEFHEQLHARGVTSWREYVLRQLFWGKLCPFAASAVGGRLDPALSSPIHKAARHDLDLLQEICVDDAVVVAWIKTAFPATKDEWLEAALSVRSHWTGPEDGEPWGEAAASLGSNGKAAAGSSEQSVPSGLCGRPATPVELAEAATKLAARERWSEGLGDLQAFYETHGAGLLGHHWVVGWQDDGLVELEVADSVAASRASLPMQEVPASWAQAASLAEAQSDALRFNTFAHLQGAATGGAKAQHCLVRGPPGIATSAALWDLLAEAAQQGLRVVQLPATASQLNHRSLGSLCRSLGRYGRMRIVVVVENLQVRGGGEDHTALITLLSGMGGGLWPENVLLYATTPEEGPLVPGTSDSGALEGCFGTTIVVGQE